jgi:hypothetical protein
MWSMPRCYKQGKSQLLGSSIQEAVKKRVSCKRALLKVQL